MTSTAQEPQTATLIAALLVLAQAKHELGFRCAFWGGRGPSVDASIALAGMALEEEGHAKVLEGFVAEELGGPPVDRDAIVRWDHWPSLASTSEHQRETWPDAMLRYFLQDLEVAAALRAFTFSPLPRLADRARKMVQEEQFHLVFSTETLRTIAGITSEARSRLRAEFTSRYEALRTAGGLLPHLQGLVACDALPSDALQAYQDHLRQGRRAAEQIFAAEDVN